MLVSLKQVDDRRSLSAKAAGARATVWPAGGQAWPEDSPSGTAAAEPIYAASLAQFRAVGGAATRGQQFRWASPQRRSKVVVRSVRVVKSHGCGVRLSRMLYVVSLFFSFPLLEFIFMYSCIFFNFTRYVFLGFVVDSKPYYFMFFFTITPLSSFLLL